jgi:superfamily II DNA or RNA helicase
MARHSLADPVMQRLADRLVELVLFTGSVRAAHREVERVLRETGDEGTVYPNRLHAILSADPTRGVNTATVELLQRAVALLEIPAGGGERDRVHTNILSAIDALGVEPSTDLREVANQCGFPLAVVQQVVRGNSKFYHTTTHTSRQELLPEASTPDWSFQELAVESAMKALRKSLNQKVGLVVPTGGGKTRIAMRISLSCLTEALRDDSVVLWVTHRLRLRRQARRELQRLLVTGSTQVAKDAVSIFEKRVIFVMVSELAQALEEYRSRCLLVVVDEAHHAAAPTYKPLFEANPIRGLFLTATPNRADGLPIGIDEIAFSVTYRDLIRCGSVVEPLFDNPLAIEGLDWTDGTGLEDLADYLLNKSETELRKILVAVSRKAHAEQLYNVLCDQLLLRPGHPLTEEDIGFVHAEATSTGVTSEEFLDEFVARPNGIIISTSQLIGEGFDDPTLESVVITYPSESIGHLMQVAGRALRAAPRKTTAHVVQVHATQMSYHFEQRWLYQDISDRLKPQLLDQTYTTVEDLRTTIRTMLQRHNVSTAVTERIEQELKPATPGGHYSLLLTGLPYFGDNFELEGAWGAILVTPESRAGFVKVFNACSDRIAEINDPRSFLSSFLQANPTRGSLWKSFSDMLAAMEYALKEIRRHSYESEDRRAYLCRRGSSWLKYATFEHKPVLSDAFSAFLQDVINRDEIVSDFSAEPSRWSAALKIPLPLFGTLALLLDENQSAWLADQRRSLQDRLRLVAPTDGFAEVRNWRSRLRTAPVPLVLLDHIDQFIAETRFGMYSLSLSTASSREIS